MVSRSILVSLMNFVRASFLWCGQYICFHCWSGHSNVSCGPHLQLISLRETLMQLVKYSLSLSYKDGGLRITPFCPMLLFAHRSTAHKSDCSSVQFRSDCSHAILLLSFVMFAKLFFPIIYKSESKRESRETSRMTFPEKFWDCSIFGFICREAFNTIHCNYFTWDPLLDVIFLIKLLGLTFILVSKMYQSHNSVQIWYFF